MDFSVYSLLISTLLCNFFIMVLIVLLKLNTTFLTKFINIISFLALMIMVRLALPVEFIFTKSIGSIKLLPPIQKVLLLSFKFIDLKEILFSTWLIVAILKFFKSFLKHKKFMMTIKCLPNEIKYNNLISKIINKKNHKISVVTLTSISSPVIVGLLKPVIILPSIQFSDAEAHLILTHELQHYRQKDLWIKSICELLSIIYWWNPIIKIFIKQLVFANEISTDISVTNKLTEKERIRYLDCLLKVAKNIKDAPTNAFSLGLINENKTHLKKRFDIILNSEQLISSKKCIFSTVIIGLLLLIASYSVIIEPYFVDPESEQNTYEINPESSFFIYNEDTYEYDLYIDNEYLHSLPYDIIKKEFKNISIRKVR